MNEAKPPVFSVIIPTYNRASTLPRAIQSVLAQTFTQFELIVVDDGSTDDTAHVVQRFADPRIRYIHQENRGRSAARNVGASASTGRYVTFLDSDDEALPDWLFHLNAALDDEGIAIVCCGAYVIDVEADQQKDSPPEISLPAKAGDFYANQTVLFRTGTFAVCRELFLAAGGYVESLAQSENTELGRRLARHCLDHHLRIASVMQPLIRYYRSRVFDPDNTSLFEDLLHSSTYMLQHHGDAFRTEPHRYGFSCGIAGVNAMRLGKPAIARRYFRMAIGSDPWYWKHYLRLALTYCPFVGRNVWRRARS